MYTCGVHPGVTGVNAVGFLHHKTVQAIKSFRRLTRRIRAPRVLQDHVDLKMFYGRSPSWDQAVVGDAAQERAAEEQAVRLFHMIDRC